MLWLLRKLVLLSFWGAVALSVLLAIFSVSIGKLLPYLDHYRPQIESNLQQITGYPITLDRIDGYLEGVDPTFSVSGFKLLAGGQSAISIDEMQIRLDTIKSIVSLSPHFTYIRFVSPSVNLREEANKWRLAGAKPSSEVKNEVGVERVFDYLSAQQNFSIFDAKVRINSERFGRHELIAPHTYLFKKSSESLLSSNIYLDDVDSPIELNARIEQMHPLLGDYRVKASIKVPVIPMPLHSFLEDKQFSLSSLQFGGNLWVNALIGKEVEVRAESTVLDVSFDDGQRYQSSPSIKIRYSQNKPNLRMTVHNFRIRDEVNNIYPSTDFIYDWSSVTKRSTVSFNQADLAIINKISAHFLPAESNAAQILGGLNPTGMAKNASLAWLLEDDDVSFEFLSNFQSASVDGYNGIPEASNIDAVFSLSDKGGYINFRGKESKLGFEDLYSAPWKTDSLAGRVSWQKQQDVFLISGQDLIVKRNGSDITGGFRFEVRQSRPDWIALDLHGQNLTVVDRLTFIPNEVLSRDIRSWIKDAFTGKGDIKTVDVLLQTELNKGSDPHVRVQMAVDNADVDFDKNWPVASEVDGFFAFDEDGVSVKVASANLKGMPVHDLLITVPIKRGNADWLNLKGSVNEESSIVLSTLRSTPLNDLVLKPFANWQLSGDIESDFAVSIPFVKDTEPKVQLGIRFEENNLVIGDINLALDIEDGNLNYSSDQGIADSEFSIQALGGASNLTLSSMTTPSGEFAVMGDLSGEVGIKDVAKWRELPEGMLSVLSGKAAYTGNLSVNKSQEGQVDLVVESDLSGVGIDLPSPAGKTIDEAKALRVKLMQHEKDIVVDVDYASFSQARLLLQDSAFVGGELQLNGKANSSFATQIPKGLVLTGSFERINIPDWQSTMTDVNGSPKSADDSFEVPKLPKWLSRVDLIVDEVNVNTENTWHNFKVSYNSSADKLLYVSSDEMNFSLQNVDDKPDLHFGFLSWNTAKDNDSGATKASSKKSPISVRQIPNMSLSIDQLYFNGNPYGDWKLNVSRDGDLVQVDPISMKLKTGSFLGRLSWLDKGENSKVDLSLTAKGENLAELTHKFSNESIVSSKSYNIDVGLGWKGHPFYFDRQSVSGHIDFSAKNGNFNKVDELPAFLKVLGIFNIGALNRRLLLDFSDVYEPGLTYDEFKGKLKLDKGIINTALPITISAPSAELVVAGKADIVNETLDEKLTATFPLSGTLPLAGLLWGTPQLAGLLYITDKLIGDQLSKVTSVQYTVKGPFSDPVMTPVQYRPLEKKD
ncbi:MAG: TIGR02099 family protein [Oceanospirillaceae bacterium]|nr:TIGR02099 family protein [Oceanospirillaceae bacterium]